MFLSDRRDPLVARTYTAESAYLLQQENSSNLVMFRGLNQVYDTNTAQLSTVSFSDLTWISESILAKARHTPSN